MCTCLPHWVSRFLVLVKVCQSPMYSQHPAPPVRPTSVDRACGALPSCWRAPVRPSHVRRSFVLRAVHPSHGAAALRACLSAAARGQRCAPVCLRSRAARLTGPRPRRHVPPARPACVQRPVRPTASTRLHGPHGLLCSSVPSEHGGDVGDRSKGLPYDLAALCPTPAGGLPNDLAAFLFGLLHVFIHVIPPC